MPIITLRQANVVSDPSATIKGAPLTNAEVDNNFANINVSIGVLSNLTTSNTSNLVLAINEVRQNVIASLSISTARLQDNAVTNIKLNEGAVSTAKISDGAVTSAKLATTGVSAATYGNATIVPVIAVGTDGRITSASNAVISVGIQSIDNLTGNNLNLSNTYFQSYKEIITNLGNVTGATSVNLSQGNIFRANLIGNTTITFTNHPALPYTMPITLIVTQMLGNNTIYVANSVFTENVLPVISTAAGNSDILTFFSPNGGAKFIGTHAVADVII